MCLAIMTPSTNALKVLPFRPLWIIHPIKWNYVIHVISSRIVAHLTHWTLLSLHSTDPFPLATISA
jgi:hypothetical protein